MLLSLNRQWPASTNYLKLAYNTHMQCTAKYTLLRGRRSGHMAAYYRSARIRFRPISRYLCAFFLQTYLFVFSLFIKPKKVFAVARDAVRTVLLFARRGGRGHSVWYKITILFRSRGWLAALAYCIILLCFVVSLYLMYLQQCCTTCADRKPRFALAEHSAAADGRNVYRIQNDIAASGLVQTFYNNNVTRMLWLYASYATKKKKTYLNFKRN